MLSLNKEVRGKPGLPVALSGASKVIYLYDDVGGAKEIKATNVTPIPRIDTRQVVLCSGPSGSGKSTIAYDYITKYIEIFPKNLVYIFTNSPDDPAYAPLKKNKKVDFVDVKLIDADTETRFPLESFKDSLMVVDDAESWEEESSKEIYKLIKKALYAGRKQKTYMFITSHDLLSGKSAAGRELKAELTTAIIFPRASSYHQIQQFLKLYVGLDAKTIKAIKDSPSRWVAINRTYPQSIVTQMGVKLIT